MSDRLAAWWRRTRPLLHPVSPDATLAWPLDQLAARVAAAMPLDLGGRVTIPEDFPRYLAVLGPHVYLSQDIDRDFTLYPASALPDQLADDARVYDDDPDLIRRAGPWIGFARRGDRDTYFLCLDAASPRFGHVLYGEDAHPWLNDLDAPHYAGLQLRGPLLDWLDTLRLRGGGSWTAIALEPSELAALEAARATGLWHMGVAARDLALVLTPDRAYQRAGAPDRLTHARGTLLLENLLDQLADGPHWIQDSDVPGSLALLPPEAAAAAAARLARLPLAPEIDRLAGVLTRGSTVLVIREPDVPAEEELFG